MSRTTSAVLAFGVLGLAASAGAQSPLVGPRDFPAVDFGRLTPGDPVPGRPGAVFTHTGLGWTVTTMAPGDPCNPKPNPYREPERALACFGAAPRLPVYAVRGVYADAYGERRIVVLSVASDLDGAPVVTAERIDAAGAGEVLSFRVTVGDAWTEVAR
jgi:hypothetical protein